VIVAEMCHKALRSGVLLVGVFEETLGGCRSRGASREQCTEQVADFFAVYSVVRCMRNRRLGLAHILLGCGNERIELACVNLGMLEQELRVCANGGESYRNRPGRHASRSCAAAICCRKLGG
jgi:hypothetical protein